MRLAVYNSNTGKDLVIKALRLPESFKYLEDDKEDGKYYFFSPDIVKKIQQTRFEKTTIKGVTHPNLVGINKSGGAK